MRLVGIEITLTTRGAPIPTNDVWIAATAARAGAPLLTDDEHSKAIGPIGAIVPRAEST